MTRIILTGASGFAGSHILEHLLVHTDWEIICPCSWKHKGTPERIIESDVYLENKDRVQVITHDLVSPFTEQTIKSFGEIDYILNVASESHVDRSITDPVPFVKNNVDLVLNMLELARTLKVKKFIQFSTDEVYGVAPDGVDHKEWSSIVPSNPYSASKASSDHLVSSYYHTYGLPMLMTNCSNNYGPYHFPEKLIP